MMTLTSANLHFHGLSVPPLCHQDDVLRTSIQPFEPPFEYRFRIPTAGDSGETSTLYLPRRGRRMAIDPMEGDR
jgi:FtsP/CotA-like multicopper oxidase with cupredoxin domain